MMESEETEQEPVEGSLEDREEKQDTATFDFQQGYGYPEPQVKDSQFKLFRDIVKWKDSTKVSNLSDVELHNVRLYQDYALFAKNMGLDVVGVYLRGRAENILASATRGVRVLSS